MTDEKLNDEAPANKEIATPDVRLGGSSGIFMYNYPRVSILSQDHVTIVSKLVCRDVDSEEFFFEKDVNLFFVMLMIDNLVLQSKNAIEAVRRDKGKILSMPGKAESTKDLVQRVADNIKIIGIAIEELLM